MLCKTIDTSAYIAEFKKRFSNFCEKSPVLLSYIVSDNKVDVVLEDTDEVITFPIQYTIDVKSFIFGIRQVLIQRAYPTISHVITKEREITLDEQRDHIEKGTPVEDIPSIISYSETIKYLIDRVIIYKDIFLLKDLSTGKMYRYKLNKSSVFFLRKLRHKKITPEEAAVYFFENAELLNEVTVTEE